MDRVRVRRLALAPLALALVCWAVAPAAAAPAAGRVVTVPLDRSGRVPGTLQLRALADTSSHGSGTILVLDGTANWRATRRLPDYASGLEPLGAHRVVTFDMRGTGGSRLDCEALTHEQPLARAIADCAGQLGPQRAFFTVAEDVADTEAVRAALGVERMTLYGFDYGARVAVAYAAAHPEHVERLVLDSPVRLDGPDPLGRSTFAAIRRIAASTCARSCRFTHDALGELTALLQRLAHRPLHARVFDGHGRPRTVVIGAAQVRDLLLAGDVSLVARMMWAPAVHAALAGDPALLARLVRTTRDASLLRAPGGALRVARMCGGRIATPPAAAVPDDAFAPFTPELAGEVSPARVCAQWPDLPSTQSLTPPTGIPTLVRSGEGALATPLEDAQALATSIPGAQLLALPLFGHHILRWSVATIGDCPEDALRAFAHDRPVKACRRTQLGFVWPQAPPHLLADVSPRRGLRGRLGRTAHAVQLTLLDAVVTLTEDLFLAFGDPDAVPSVVARRYGGLHGGFVRITKDGFRLRRYSYIPGVTLTGVYGDKGALRIGGSAAVHGRLRLSDRSCGESACFVGRLGGRLVHVTIPGSA
jgi:pimeloyl-ACP methyl ester carboxylesterase